MPVSTIYNPSLLRRLVTSLGRFGGKASRTAATAPAKSGIRTALTQAAKPGAKTVRKAVKTPGYFTRAWRGAPMLFNKQMRGLSRQMFSEELAKGGLRAALRTPAAAALTVGTGAAGLGLGGLGLGGYGLSLMGKQSAAEKLAYEVYMGRGSGGKLTKIPMNTMGEVTSKGLKKIKKPYAELFKQFYGKSGKIGGKKLALIAGLLGAAGTAGYLSTRKNKVAALEETAFMGAYLHTLKKLGMPTPKAPDVSSVTSKTTNLGGETGTVKVDMPKIKTQPVSLKRGVSRAPKPQIAGPPVSNPKLGKDVRTKRPDTNLI